MDERESRNVLDVLVFTILDFKEVIKVYLDFCRWCNGFVLSDLCIADSLLIIPLHVGALITS